MQNSILSATQALVVYLENNYKYLNTSAASSQLISDSYMEILNFENSVEYNWKLL